MKENYKGLLLCILIAVPAWIIGKMFPVIGGPVVAIILGMVVTSFIKDKSNYTSGIRFASKKILQWAVILLGFGLNLSVVIYTGKQSLPIIIVTISMSLLIAFVLQKFMKVDRKIATLVGIGSSVCGGSAIAAAAPVIDADDEEVAQAIAVIFFFNVIAAILFPQLGSLLGFSAESGESFGVFAGTAINDTSSVKAAASTWDSIHNLGSATLDKAVTVILNFICNKLENGFTNIYHIFCVGICIYHSAYKLCWYRYLFLRSCKGTKQILYSNCNGCHRIKHQFNKTH